MGVMPRCSPKLCCNRRALTPVCSARSPRLNGRAGSLSMSSSTRLTVCGRSGLSPSWRSSDSDLRCARTSPLISRFSSCSPAAGPRRLISPLAKVCGIFSPPTKCERVDGGYILSGRWPYSSGSFIADWATLGCALDRGPRPNQPACSRTTPPSRAASKASGSAAPNRCYWSPRPPAQTACTS